jgi:hypothetical protein
MKNSPSKLAFGLSYTAVICSKGLPGDLDSALKISQNSSLSRVRPVHMRMAKEVIIASGQPWLNRHEEIYKLASSSLISSRLSSGELKRCERFFIVHE